LERLTDRFYQERTVDIEGMQEIARPDAAMDCAAPKQSNQGIRVETPVELWLAGHSLVLNAVPRHRTVGRCNIAANLDCG